MGHMSWHGQIMAPLSENFIRRMRNWTRAKVSGASRGYARMRWDDAPRGSSWHEAPLPLLSGEADDTDAALQTLDIRERRAVMLFWAWEKQELTTLARRCGGIDVRTYRDRVMRGHVALIDALARRTAQWTATRRRNQVQHALVRAG